MLLDANDGGIYGLTNPLGPGASDVWVGLNGNIACTEFYSVAYDTVDGVVMGGSQDNSSPIQSSAQGTQWEILPDDGGDGGYVAIDNSLTIADAPIDYYMADGPNDFMVSTNQNGTSAQLALEDAEGDAPLFSGLDTWDAGLASAEDPYSFAFILNAADPTRMLIGNSGVYESQATGWNEPPGMYLNNVTPSGLLSATGNVPNSNSNPPQTATYHWISAMAYGTATNVNAAYVASLDPNFSRSLNGQLFVASQAVQPQESGSHLLAGDDSLAGGRE